MVKRILLFILLAGVWAHAGVLFVLNSGSETLSRIDTESGVINNSFAALGSLPNRLECDRNFIYVVNSGGNSVQKIAVSDGTTNHYLSVKHPDSNNHDESTVVQWLKDNVFTGDKSIYGANLFELIENNP